MGCDLPRVEPPGTGRPRRFYPQAMFSRDKHIELEWRVREDPMSLRELFCRLGIPYKINYLATLKWNCRRCIPKRKNRLKIRGYIYFTDSRLYIYNNIGMFECIRCAI